MTGRSHLPPAPPANRAPQGGSNLQRQGDIAADVAEGVQESKDRKLASQGRQRNIKANTANRGCQQDR